MIQLIFHRKRKRKKKQGRVPVSQAIKQIIGVVVYAGVFVIGILDRHDVFEHIKKWVLQLF